MSALKRLRARTLPDEGTASGWYALLPPPPPVRRLRSRERADCAVVGAGFTGLAAAHQLAELRPAWRILILEAQQVGLGTSGRNSGFVVDFANNSAWTDREVRHRAARVNRAGIAHLRGRVRELGIEEHWSEAGWLHTVASEHTMSLLEALVGLLDEAGEPFERFDADRLRSLLGTCHYQAALRIPGGAMVQPAALVRALAGHLPENVELYEESPVHTIAGGGKVRVGTREGEVEADRLIIAVNGFSPALGVLCQRVFPLLTFAALTRELTPQERRTLGGEPEWGLIALEPLGTSVRRTRDHRILIRNTTDYRRDACGGPALLRRAERLRRQALQERFPELEEVDFEFRWSGVLGITRNQLPAFGKLDDNVFTAAGFNGAGISMGTIAGRLLARLVAGEDSELLGDMLELPKPTWIPPEPLFGPIARHHLRRLEKRAFVKL